MEAKTYKNISQHDQLGIEPGQTGKREIPQDQEDRMVERGAIEVVSGETAEEAAPAVGEVKEGEELKSPEEIEAEAEAKAAEEKAQLEQKAEEERKRAEADAQQRGRRRS